MELTLVTDGPLVQHEMATMRGHTLTLGNEIVTAPARMEQAALRMPVDSALQMALNIADDMQEHAPATLEKVGLTAGKQANLGAGDECNGRNFRCGNHETSSVPGSTKATVHQEIHWRRN